MSTRPHKPEEFLINLDLTLRADDWADAYQLLVGILRDSGVEWFAVQEISKGDETLEDVKKLSTDYWKEAGK